MKFFERECPASDADLAREAAPACEAENAPGRYLAATSIELRALSWVERHREVLFVAIISVLAFVARLGGRHFVSGDASGSLLPWFETISQLGGLASLSQQVGNYNIPYQVLIALMTYVPLHPLSLYKGLSILFDYALAIATAGFACDICRGGAFQEHCRSGLRARAFYADGDSQLLGVGPM